MTSLAQAAQALDVAIEFLTPEGFLSLQLPTYPGLRVALCGPGEIARRIERAAPDAIQPKGRSGIAYAPIASGAGDRSPRVYDAIPGIHRGASTDSEIVDLCVAAALSRRRRGDHGVDAVADVRARAARISPRYPEAKFLGLQSAEVLARHLAAADVFVFPSLTDTFGVVQLEALACGTPVAAFPVMGPKDVIGDSPVGVLHRDLRAACLAALGLSRKACRDFALAYGWERSVRQFIGHVERAAVAGSRTIQSDTGIHPAARDAPSLIPADGSLSPPAPRTPHRDDSGLRSAAR